MKPIIRALLKAARVSGHTWPFFVLLVIVAGCAHAQGTRQAATAPRRDGNLKAIYNNISDYRYGRYYSYTASLISQTYWFAVPFTPTTDVLLAKVEVPLMNRFPLSGGTVAIWLAASEGLLPGATLAGPIDVVIPDAVDWSCCGLATARFEDVPLVKGTQYWLVVGTDENSGTTQAVWFLVSTDMRFHPQALHTEGVGWQPVNGILPAVRILGR